MTSRISTELYGDNLRELDKLISQLPPRIPVADANKPRYDFVDFRIEAGDYDVYGSEAKALCHKLTWAFTPGGLKENMFPPFLILEQGPGLSAVTQALQSVISRCGPDCEIENWIRALLTALRFETFSGLRSPSVSF